MSKPKEMTPERLAECRRVVEGRAWAEGPTLLKMATYLVAHVDALTERVEVAERERDAAAMSLESLISGSDRAKDVELQLVKRQRERADAAEKKLKALVEATKPGSAWHVRLWDAINAYTATTTSRASVARQKAVVAIEDALRAARGES